MASLCAPRRGGHPFTHAFACPWKGVCPACGPGDTQEMQSESYRAPPPQEASGCGKTSLPEPQPSLQLLAPGPIVQMRRLRQRWKFLKATLLYLLESSGGPWTVFPSSPHLSYCDFDMGSSFLLENFSHLAPLQVKVSRLPWPAAGQYTF